MQANGFIILAAGVFVVSQAVHAGDDEKKPERWIKVVEIGEEIYNLKKEMQLTPEQADKIFQKEFPRLKEDWREQLPTAIEPAPNALGLPDLKENIKPKDTTPCAGVLRFSPTQVVVVVLKP